MFLIVPKPKKGLSALPPLNSNATTQAFQAQQQRESMRGRVRSQTACDVCRLRKAKCNGQRPCGRCREKDIICVYTRTAAKPDQPSSSQVALLQRQKRRLKSALQSMASVISHHQDSEPKAPSDFDVLELLEQYAPLEDDHDKDHASPVRPDAVVESPSHKRQRDDSASCDSDVAAKRPCSAIVSSKLFSTTAQRDADGQQLIPREPPSNLTSSRNTMDDQALMIEFGSTSSCSDLADYEDANYEAMLQFYLLAGPNNPINNTLDHSINYADTQFANPAQGVVTEAQQAPIMTSGLSLTAEAPMQQLMSLVDWRSSLQSFPGRTLDTPWTMPPATDDMSMNMDINMDMGGMAGDLEFAAGQSSS